LKELWKEHWHPPPGPSRESPAVKTEHVLLLPLHHDVCCSLGYGFEIVSGRTPGPAKKTQDKLGSQAPSIDSHTIFVKHAAHGGRMCASLIAIMMQLHFL
jgi:hypothetical protein